MGSDLFFQTSKSRILWSSKHCFPSLIKLFMWDTQGLAEWVLVSKKAMCMILHVTFMNIVVDSFPQVLFTMHLYSPPWFLLMLMIVSSFPLVTWPVLTFFQMKFRGWVPAATLHSFVTFLLSSTVTFRSCSIVGGSVRNTFKWGVNTVLLLIQKMQL